MEGAQQGSLIVEGLTCIGDEDGGDTKGVVDDEHGRRGIPSRIAAGLEGVADTSIGERRGVGLLLDEQFAAEVLHHASLAIVLHEGIVLLGSTLRQWLEPVGIVGGTHLQGPLFHTLGHGISDAAV